MQNVLAVFLGGGIGAVLRYLTGVLMLRVLSVNLPVATFVVNIAGSFILGFLYVLFIERPEINPALKFALTVGFCGGLTTFSTFSLELVEMLKSYQFLHAGMYAVLSVVVCIIAIFAGAYCAKFV